MMEAPPVLKKQKFQKYFKVIPILPDNWTQLPHLELVITSEIQDKKCISKVIAALKEKLPLLSLIHLKRVRPPKIIVCRKADLHVKETLQQFLTKKQIPVHIIDILCEKTDETEVPSKPALLQWQHDILSSRWPSKFHPNKYMERMYNGNVFTSTELHFHLSIAKLLEDLSDMFALDEQYGICIDPRYNSIVAVAKVKTQNNSFVHCPMLLIDNVALTQSDQITKNCESNDYEITLLGIPNWFQQFVKSERLEQFFQLGAEIATKFTHKIDSKIQICEGEDNLEKYGPYLCTGYDVYLSREPCLMCAMALVHSRVRRIFFLSPSSNGALKTQFKLQSVKELNHHYEVFHLEEAVNYDNIL